MGSPEFKKYKCLSQTLWREVKKKKTLYRIWTRVIDSILYVNNCLTKRAFYTQPFYQEQRVTQSQFLCEVQLVWNEFFFS